MQPHVATTLEYYVALFQQTARANEAKRMEALVKAIRAKSECVVPPGSRPRGRDFRLWLCVTNAPTMKGGAMLYER